MSWHIDLMVKKLAEFDTEVMKQTVDPVGVQKVNKTAAPIFEGPIHWISHFFWRRSAQRQFDTSYKDCLAAAVKASAFSKALSDETCGISHEQNALMSRGVMHPMLRELIAHQELVCRAIEKGRLYPTVFFEFDCLYKSFCHEVGAAKNVPDAPLPNPSVVSAISATREFREKLEAFQKAAAELENAKGVQKT